MIPRHQVAALALTGAWVGALIDVAALVFVGPSRWMAVPILVGALIGLDACGRISNREE